MALQTTGPIKISEIKAELGSSSNSLRTLSAAAGFSTPDAMSEFYGYSSAPPVPDNPYYWRADGVNDYVFGNWAYGNDLATSSWSISVWIRQNQDTTASQQLIDWNGNPTLNSGNTDNRVMFNYNGSLNRLMLRIRTARVNYDRQWALHDNSSVTGITSVGWDTSRRGYVNAAGWVHLVVTYDAAQGTSSSALKLYWNGNELTSQAAANNGGRTPMDFPVLALGASVHNIGGGNANIDMDEFAFYDGVLNPAEINILYNSGVIVHPDYLLPNGLAEKASFNPNDIEVLNGIYSGTYFGGQVLNH